MTGLDHHYNLSPLAAAELDVAYYVTPGGWVPVHIGGTKTILVETMPDTACQGCPLAAYSHILRAIPARHGAYEKLCTVPFLRAGKLALDSLMQYRGCGATDSDYARAKRLMKRERRSA